MDVLTPLDLRQRAGATRNPIRKLYFWTLHWAAHRRAEPALFGISFLESSVFPVPPDVLLIAMTFARTRRWARLAAICSLASVLGGLFGYWIGWALWDSVGRAIVEFYRGEAVMERLSHWYQEFGFLGVLAAAVTPIPYKVFTIASGWFRFDLFEFLLASVMGRSLRFFLVAGLVARYGEAIRPFLERRLEWALGVLTALAVLGFLLLKAG